VTQAAPSPGPGVPVAAGGTRMRFVAVAARMCTARSDIRPGCSRMCPFNGDSDAVCGPPQGRGLTPGSVSPLQWPHGTVGAPPRIPTASDSATARLAPRGALGDSYHTLLQPAARRSAASFRSRFRKSAAGPSPAARPAPDRESHAIVTGTGRNGRQLSPSRRKQSFGHTEPSGHREV
jgi:hypothetical protein